MKLGQLVVDDGRDLIYKVVMKLSCRQQEIVQGLVPTRPIVDQGHREDVPTRETAYLAKALSPSKAPGVDRVSDSRVKAVILKKLVDAINSRLPFTYLEKDDYP